MDFLPSNLNSNQRQKKRIKGRINRLRIKGNSETLGDPRIGEN